MESFKIFFESSLKSLSIVNNFVNYQGVENLKKFLKNLIISKMWKLTFLKIPTSSPHKLSTSSFNFLTHIFYCHVPHLISKCQWMLRRKSFTQKNNFFTRCLYTHEKWVIHTFNVLKGAKKDWRRTFSKCFITSSKKVHSWKSFLCHQKLFLW